MNQLISNKELKIEINPLGAELVSLKRNHDNKEYIWEGNPHYWGKHSPVLFPIVGSLKNNCYTYKNKEYSLNRHGFAREMLFDIIEKKENSITFSLQSNNETLSVYPFEFELQIKYTLIDTKLQIQYLVLNNSNFEMPFSIGAHPAFALPKKFEEYSLAFDKKETLTCYELQNELVSSNYPIYLKENILSLNYSLFEKDALIFKNLDSKKITILENEKPLVSIDFKDFKNLGIWTKVDAPFICIEPWLGYSDTIDTTGELIKKEGIQFLDSKTTFDCTFSIEIL